MECLTKAYRHSGIYLTIPSNFTIDDQYVTIIQNGELNRFQTSSATKCLQTSIGYLKDNQICLSGICVSTYLQIVDFKKKLRNRLLQQQQQKPFVSYSNEHCLSFSLIISPYCGLGKLGCVCQDIYICVLSFFVVKSLNNLMTI